MHVFTEVGTVNEFGNIVCFVRACIKAFAHSKLISYKVP
jgi:hypothetical protein